MAKKFSVKVARASRKPIRKSAKGGGAQGNHMRTASGSGLGRARLVGSSLKASTRYDV